MISWLSCFLPSGWQNIMVGSQEVEELEGRGHRKDSLQRQAKTNHYNVALPYKMLSFLVAMTSIHY